MKKIRLYLILAVLLGFSFSSCSDWLDVDPIDRTMEGKQYSTEEGILSVQNGLYTEMVSTNLYGGHLALTSIEALGNRYAYPPEATANASVAIKQLSTFTYDKIESKNVLYAIWQNSYKLTFRINNYLKGLEQSTASITQDKKDLLMGEGYALRAYMHFDLFRLFGPFYSTMTLDFEALPYNDIIPDGDYAENILVQKPLSVKDFMDKVLGDIEKAEALMEKIDPIVKNFEENAGVYELEGNQPYKNRTRRLNYYALRAFKARVLHYMNDPEAVKIAQEILDLNKFVWQTGEQTSHGTASYYDYNLTKEVLFGLANKDFKKTVDKYFKIESSTKGYFEGSVFRKNVFNLEGDFRKQFTKKASLTIGAGFPSAIDALYYGQRFDVTQDENYARYYFQPLIRLSEMYYIIAESKVRSGDLSGAITYINDFLNKVRKVNSDYCLGGTSSPDLKDTDTPTEDILLKVITREYYREFAYEGQVFFFNKRMQAKDLSTPFETINGNTGNFTALPKNIWATYWVPIPDAETDY
ncbi:MAG: RagB/SusD family nutrient uptake outer membrane protein [Dysgonomonas sp.]|nr:RagB/SusD family nutrient uptake outer membrane protein [Dysgonomonas sp.]